MIRRYRVLAAMLSAREFSAGTLSRATGLGLRSVHAVIIEFGELLAPRPAAGREPSATERFAVTPESLPRLREIVVENRRLLGGAKDLEAADSLEIPPLFLAAEDMIFRRFRPALADGEGLRLLENAKNAYLGARRDAVEQLSQDDLAVTSHQALLDSLFELCALEMRRPVLGGGGEEERMGRAKEAVKAAAGRLAECRDFETAYRALLLVDGSSPRVEEEAIARAAEFREAMDDLLPDNDDEIVAEPEDEPPPPDSKAGVLGKTTPVAKSTKEIGEARLKVLEDNAVPAVH